MRVQPGSATGQQECVPVDGMQHEGGNFICLGKPLPQQLLVLQGQLHTRMPLWTGCQACMMRFQEVAQGQRRSMQASQLT